VTETIRDIISVAAGAWYHLPLGILIVGVTFGFMPGLVLNLGVLIYPKDHPRRKELIAELHEVPYFKRAFWVFYALQLAVTEGISARIDVIRDRRFYRLCDRREAVLQDLNRQLANFTGDYHVEAYSKSRNRLCWLVVKDGKVLARFVIPGIRVHNIATGKPFSIHLHLWGAIVVLRQKLERFLLRRKVARVRNGHQRG